MDFAVVAKFPDGETFYLNGRNQFDPDIEHARRFEAVQEAQQAAVGSETRQWVRGRQRIDSPEYTVTMV